MLYLNGVKSTIVDDYSGTGYSSAMLDASKKVKAINASLAIEMHFNSASSSASGHEWLHWETSKNGLKLAECFRDSFKKSFPASKDRGLKAITKNDRGGAWLRLTHCPSVICEPFFGSNIADSSQFATDAGVKKLARSYCVAILDYMV